jgi:ABC-type nitrate/sulfonate/bicarbonate transport system permease component
MPREGGAPSNRKRASSLETLVVTGSSAVADDDSGEASPRSVGTKMKPMSDKAIERLLYLVSPIGLIAVWQLLLMAGFGDRRFIPAPSDIAVRFVQMVGSGELALHTAVTLWRIAAGYVIGAIPAVAVGLLMAMFRPVRLFFDPLIAALFPIPKVALMPLLLLAFGFGDASKIALVAIAVFFPVIVNTYVGAANIDKIYWDVARNYGASQTVLFTRIVFFGALPMIFAGLRIALAVSFIVLVAAEFVATKAGIGYLIWNSWELLQVDVMFVGIVTIGILGLISSALFQEIERKVIPWKAE